MDEYKHKPGAEKDRTHYCPGCGHGIIHKLLAEAMEDFDIIEKSIMISPVGCSVFAYYYFNTGNLQVPHGRAPAVATAVSRANPDSVVVSYQGDGDLAAIGGNNILQAANRGENILVVFVNNAIYGMTGGQMAPTTLEGQKTTTTPYGRNHKTDGYPMKVSEVISQLHAPVYVARTSVHNAANIRKTREAIRKGLRNVVDKRGFSLVEILSMCPSGWKVAPDKGPEWIEEYMVPEYPLGVYKDRGEDVEIIERPVPEMDPARVKKNLDLETEKDRDITKPDVDPKYKDPSIRIAGFGGQGIMVTGQVLATVGMKYGYNVTWLPSYGPEMRGGTANCSVKIQEKMIGASEATSPTVIIAMNRPSMDKFEKIIAPGGALIYNSTLVEIEPSRKDIEVFPVPITGLADGLGNTRVQSMVNVGAFAAVTGLFDIEEIVRLLPVLFASKASLIALNEKAVRAGYEYIKTNF